MTVGKLHIAFMLTSLNGGGAERVMLDIEVNAMYQSLATGGLRQPLRAIRGVTDRHGRPLGRYPERSTRVADTSPRTGARTRG